jgi:hypothetical protein
VKRHLSCLPILFFALIAARVAAADQPPANGFGGQIIAGVDGKRVGIGTREPAATLDVYQGEVKIGSTGAPCTKELIGTLRFRDDQLWICNSYGWRPLVTAVPAQ